MNPYITHPLVASAEYLVLLGLLTWVSTFFGVTSVPLWVCVALAPTIAVVAFYYGREAGQRAHDLKHTIPPHGEVAAFLGGEFMVLWTVDNLLQWLAAVAGVLACTATVVALNYWT